MPDISSLSPFSKENYHRGGSVPKGTQMNQIGKLLNNISAQNGVRAVVNQSGIKIYGTGQSASITHRFKIVRSTEDDSDANPCLHVYKGDWIRNDERVSLTLTEDPENPGTYFDYYEIPWGEINEGINWIYVGLDQSLDPVTLEAGITNSLSDIEPSTDNNKYRVIGTVTLSGAGDLLAPVQFVFEDIKDNINMIETSEDVWSDGGTGIVVKVITDMQYDTDSTLDLQYKYRNCTIKMGWIEIGEESDWETWAETAECDEYNP